MDLDLLEPVENKGRRRHRSASRRRAVPRRRRVVHRNASSHRRRSHLGHYVVLNKGRRHAAHRNAGRSSIVSSVMETGKSAIVALAGIQVNQLAGNLVASKLLGVSGLQRSLTKVGTAVALPVLASFVVPRAYHKMLTEAAGAAIAIEAAKYLNQNVLPAMGDMGSLMSSSDIDVPAGYVAPAPAVIRPFGWNPRVNAAGGFARDIKPMSALIGGRAVSALIGNRSAMSASGVYDSDNAASGAVY